MPVLLFTCPKTHAVINTGIVMDAPTFVEAKDKRICVSCPYCGAGHDIYLRDTFVAGDKPAAA